MSLQPSVKNGQIQPWGSGPRQTDGDAGAAGSAIRQSHDIDGLLKGGCKAASFRDEAEAHTCSGRLCAIAILGCQLTLIKGSSNNKIRPAIVDDLGPTSQLLKRVKSKFLVGSILRQAV